MTWKALVRGVRWLVDLRAHLSYTAHHAPIHRLRREWRAQRRAQRLLDERLVAFDALPREEQVGFIHPSSPRKPPGWTLERYKETQRRRDGAH